MDCTPFQQAFQELNQRFITLLDDLSALRTLSSLGRHEISEEELLRDSIRVLMDNYDLECCSIFLLEGDQLCCAAGMDWQDRLPEEERDEQATPRIPMRFKLGEGLVGLAAQTGRIQHCQDVRNEPHFVRTCAPHLSQDIGSLVCVPIRQGKFTYGVINVSHSQTGFFDSSHDRMLDVFASFTAQLLANWRYRNEMEKEIQRRTLELEAALEEAEELKRRYHQLSIIDELTGLHNRRFFFPEASATLANAIRHQQPFSLIMLDMDHFKAINDKHGHGVGDNVLEVSAALLKGQVREGDILARFGGEEFILALPNTDLQGACELAERILHSIRTVEFTGAGKGLHVTATIGISYLDNSEATQARRLEQLLREADRALYQGKDRGRDCYRVYET